MAVYYALSYANNFGGHYLLQTIPRSPFLGTAKPQLDSMVCAMESKFVLMKGVLLPGDSCSVLKRTGAQLPSKPAKVTDKPDSDQSDRE